MGKGEVDGGESHGGALKLRGARSSRVSPSAGSSRAAERRSTEDKATDADKREKRQ
jgi:hypothetical protein